MLSSCTCNTHTRLSHVCLGIKLRTVEKYLISSITMAIQKDVDLNTPLDNEKAPSLAKSPLTPDLVVASLNLHGDFYRQLQSKFNRHMFWHPISKTVFVASLSASFLYRLWDYIVISDSVIEFLSFARKSNDFVYQLFMLFPVLVIFFGITGLTAYILGDDLRGISDDLLKKGYATDIFGFDVREFSRLPAPTEASATGTSVEKKSKSKTKDPLAVGKNSEIILYRDSPIAIVTLNPQAPASDSLTIKISGIHTRKVFAKADFDSLLIDWAILRAKEIAAETGSKAEKLILEINGYSFEPELANTLIQKDFKVVSQSYNFHSFEDKEVGYFLLIFHKLFNLKKQVYQYEIRL